MYSKLILVCFALLVACSSNKSSLVKEGDKFTWDFSKEREYKYAYEEKFTRFGNSGHGIMEERTKYIHFGDISIASKGNGLANFIFKVSDEVNNPNFRGRKRECENMDDKSNFSSEVPCKLFEGTMEIMFPLPSNDLTMGEKDRKVSKHPVTNMGVSGYVYGYYDLEYVGDIEPGIALFKCEMIADSTVFEDSFSGSYDAEKMASAEYTFDYELGFFKTVHIEMSTLWAREFYIGLNHYLDSTYFVGSFEACYIGEAKE